MVALTLDQIRVFIAVADAGSFSKAAKSLNRAQSAVTYAIKRLEAETEVVVFDRSAYRPVLTEGGKALLVRARRIAEEASAFHDQATSLASGLEPELSIALDPMFPMPVVVDALKAFSARFPSVPPRVHVLSLGAAAKLVTEGTCVIGMLPLIISDLTLLKSFPMLRIDLVPVVAASHPLAFLDGPIATETLHRFVQLVLSDASEITAGRDYGILSSRTWRVADLGAKKSMLLAGLGWGSMPAHLVVDEIARGELTRIDPAGFDPMTARLVLAAAYSAERSLGPAAAWMIDHLGHTRDR
ncbi:LysR family transcriptional regulator [Methylobacterium sp. WL64]|uniref:LysR family transcriptional regulator n=1 Tax=Methylobacterium sp. WL64 TaxID=2603894 RepID=UPI0011C8858A|nr:LysR family transcriptional regulator [Methylobacterium sp. WL64]TXN00167.1 LysR family transcriptional regulator [Methylobacterium sp. WL64]